MINKCGDGWKDYQLFFKEPELDNFLGIWIPGNELWRDGGGLLNEA
jgi:hypothetical protein